MPSHPSHLLQPLDIGCFEPLKQVNGQKIEYQVRVRIFRVPKLEFLAASKEVNHSVFTRNNIYGAWRGSGLFPHYQDLVLENLNLTVRTLSQQFPTLAPWQSQTLSNAREVACQTILIQDKIACHQDSLPTPRNTALAQLAKGAQKIAASAAMMAQETSDLRKANEAIGRRKVRVNKKHRSEGGFTVANALVQVAASVTG